MRREVAAAVRLLPNDAYIALAVAMLQQDKGWYDEAGASYERAMVLNPREGKVFYNYSVPFCRKGCPRYPPVAVGFGSSVGTFSGFHLLPVESCVMRVRVDWRSRSRQSDFGWVACRKGSGWAGDGSPLHHRSLRARLS